MQLTPHFTLEELTASAIAAFRGIDNTMPPELQANIEATAQMLERIRAFLSGLKGEPVPIVVSSGYRSLALNRFLGSKDSSDHVRAMAADWSAPSFGTPYQVCKALAPRVNALAIGQLIHECPMPGRLWVHTSTRVPEQPVNRVITISHAGTELGIQEV
jgi:hypothetical protein